MRYKVIGSSMGGGGEMVFYQTTKRGPVMSQGAREEEAMPWTRDGITPFTDLDLATAGGFTYALVFDEGELNDEAIAMIAEKYGIRIKL